MKVTINLLDTLIESMGNSVLIPATIDLTEVFEFTDTAVEQTVDIDDLLRGQNAIAFVWDVQHVLGLCPDLTAGQAWAVLERCHQNWSRKDDPLAETIRRAADDLLSSPKETLQRRVRFLLREIDALPDREADDPAAYGEAAAGLDAVEHQAKGD